MRKLSYTEQRFAHTQNNITFGLTLTQPIDPITFTQAVKRSCTKHPLSSATIKTIDNKLVFQHQALSNHNFELGYNAINKSMIQEKLNMSFANRHYKIDIVWDPLSKQLLVTCPHYICDATAIMIFLSSVFQIYQALISDTQPKHKIFKPPPFPQSLETIMHTDFQHKVYLKNLPATLEHPYKTFIHDKVFLSNLEHLLSQFKCRTITSLVSGIGLKLLANRLKTNCLRRYLAVDARRIFQLPHDFVNYAVGVSQLIKPIHNMDINEIILFLRKLNQKNLSKTALKQTRIKKKLPNEHTLGLTFIDCDTLSTAFDLKPFISEISAHVNAFTLSEKQFYFLIMTKFNNVLNMSIHYDTRSGKKDEAQALLGSIAQSFYMPTKHENMEKAIWT